MSPIHGSDLDAARLREAQRRRITERNELAARRVAERAFRSPSDEPVRAAIDNWYAARISAAMDPKDSPEALMAAAVLKGLAFGLLPLAWIINRLHGHPGAEDVFLLVTAAAIVCSLLLGVFAMFATSWPDTTSRWRAQAARASLIGWILVLVVSSMLQAVAFVAYRHGPLVRIGALEVALWHLGCAGPSLLPTMSSLALYLAWVSWRVPFDHVAAQLGGTVECDGAALRRWLDRCWQAAVHENLVDHRAAPTYVVQARRDDFELALEVTFAGFSMPRVLVLVAAAIDVESHAAMTDGELARLRALDVTIAANGGGIVATVPSAALPRSARGRERWLYEVVLEIVGLLRAVGARPLAAIEAGE